MIEINEQTTTKVKYPKVSGYAKIFGNLVIDGDTHISRTN